MWCNAMLVSGSIFQACRFYELFSQTELAGKCAIVTSYSPSPGDIKGEETGAGATEKLRRYAIYNQMLNGQDPAPLLCCVPPERIDQDRAVLRRRVHTADLQQPSSCPSVRRNADTSSMPASRRGRPPRPVSG